MSAPLTGRALAVDLNRQSRERMGLAPSVDPGAGSTLTIRLPADLHGAFMQACYEADVSASQVLRAAIREFIGSARSEGRA